MTVYIVGTDHDMQHDAPSRRAAPDKVQRARREFQAYLYTLVDRLKLQVIAEEFSQQALDGYNAESTVRPVADKLGIEHRFCDPGATERVELGLPHPFLDHCEEREKTATKPDKGILLARSSFRCTTSRYSFHLRRGARTFILRTRKK